METITRREAVIRMATLMGATVVGPRLLAATLDSKAGAAHGFSAADVALLDEIGETIIPATDVPGAKAVQIGTFLAMMVTDCYEARDQAVFREGLARIEAAHRARFGASFVSGSPANRTTLLNELDGEQKRYTAELRQRAGNQPSTEPPHFFRIMKELTILGYFSSEIGATQGVRFTEVPGRYDGAAPHKKGDRGWFSS